MKGRRVTILGLLLSVLLLCACGEKAEIAPATPSPLVVSTPAPPPAPVDESLLGLRISELMPDNESPYYRSQDWIELYNAGSAVADLTGCGLSEKEDDPLAWTFGELSLAPGEYVVLPCRDLDNPNSPNFSLSKEGENLVLSAPNGETLHKVSFGASEENHSVCFDGDEATTTHYPTPGADNSYESWLNLRESMAYKSPLQINEVMTANFSLIPQPDGEYYDWVELKNTSSEPLSLQGYSMNDKGDVSGSFPLPDVTLQPGGLYLLLCSKEAGERIALPNSGISLNGVSETLFLFDKEGECVDYVFLHNLTTGGSMGRVVGEAGFSYFTNPTPGFENAGECAPSRSDMPISDVPSGRYEEQGSISVALSGEGEIHYTLNGSVPTALDPVYTTPLTIRESCVLRAISLSPEKLAGQVLTCHYLFEPEEKLDIVSLAADNDTFQSFYKSIDKSLEIPVHMAFLGLDGSFSEDCGLNFHGNSEMSAEGTYKSLSLRFRSRYGASPVQYNLFGQEESFSSLVLRTGISRDYWFIADPLYGSLAREYTDSLAILGCRFVSVYVNGEFFALFQLRDRYSKDYFAQRWNVSKESVEIVRLSELTQELAGPLTSIAYSDMTDADAYTKVAEQVDMQDLVDWAIIQAYCGNMDFRTNVKFVRSNEHDGRWHIILFDMDRAFMFEDGFSNLKQTASGTTPVFAEVFASLFRSKEFSSLLCERLINALNGPLNTAHTLEVLEELHQQSDEALRRSLVNMDRSVERYEAGYADLYSMIEKGDVPAVMRQSAMRVLNLSPEEKAVLEQAGGTP